MTTPSKSIVWEQFTRKAALALAIAAGTLGAQPANAEPANAEPASEEEAGEPALEGDFDQPLNDGNRLRDRARDLGPGASRSSSTATFVMNDNGREVRIEARDARITRVEVDGKQLPENRYRYNDKDGKVELLAEDGSVERAIAFRLGGRGAVIGRMGDDHMGDEGWRDFGRKMADMERRMAQMHRDMAQGQRNRANNWVPVPPIPGAGIVDDEGPAPPVMLGITMSDRDDAGVTVDSVIPDLTADKAGLKAGDALLKFDGMDIRDSEHLREVLKNLKPDQKVEVLVERDGQQRGFSLTMQKYERDRLRSTQTWNMNLGDGNFHLPDNFMLFTDTREVAKSLDASIEALESATQRLNDAGEAEAVASARESVRAALESLRKAREQLGRDRTRDWIFGDDGQGGRVFIAPQPPRAPRAPVAPGESATQDEVRELREKLQEIERKLEERQKP